MHFPTFVCVDVETTGLTPELNEVIEIGMVRVQDGQIVAQYSSLVRAERQIPPYVQYLTGITNEDLVTAPQFADIVEDVLAFIGDSYFVAHNVEFDLKMVNTELRRLSRPILENPYFDSRDLGLILYPNFGSHKLALFATALGIEFAESHRALADAAVLAEIMLRMFVDLRRLDPLVFIEATRVLGDNKPGLKAVFTHFCPDVTAIRSFDYKDYLPNLTRDEIAARPEIKDWRAEAAECLTGVVGLKSILGNFEERPQQEEMAAEVADALYDEHHAVLEAGTGIGKSMAYLIPSIYFALASGTPVVVATKTKHLQSQLVDQDIATLRRIIPFGFEVAVVKGKENFVDIEFLDEMIAGMRSRVRMVPVIEYLAVYRWVLLTETGDLSELHPSLYQRFASMLAFRRFKPIDYSRNSKCFVARMRQKAQGAHVIITNHAMVLSDVAADNAVLPAYRFLVIDEAHSFADAVTGAFTRRLGPDRVAEVVNLIADTWGGGLSEVHTEWQQFRARKTKLQEHLKKITETGQEDVERGVIQIGITDEVMLSKKWQSITKTLNTMDELLKKIGSLAEARANDPSMPVASWIALKEEIATMRADIAAIENPDPGHVLWVERIPGSRRDFFEILSAPLRCQRIIESEVLAAKSAVIFTSATMSVSGKLDYFVSQMGLDRCRKPVETRIFGTEFNYAVQAIHAKVSGVERDSDVANQVMAIVTHLGGNSLVLFTSIKQMKAVYHRMRDAMRDANIPLYCQQLSGPKESIIARFKAEKGRAVMLGVDSFWEGVDITGQALSCVIMVKLPFPVPSDPVLQARQNIIHLEGGNGFRDYYLPQAVIKFRQGIGRLIRSKRDRGVLFVLDSRLYTQSYRSVFLAEISEYQLVEGSLEVVLAAAKHHVS